jgi:serine/threonine protein kinase
MIGQRLTSAEDGNTVDLHTATGELHTATGKRPPVPADKPSASSQGDIGRVLRDRYVLVEHLGQGGKGSVFKALDRFRANLPENKQYVAIKILHATSADREQRFANLRREFYCAQMLSHRNIVNVFELDRDADIDFFTMELLEGERLSRVMSRLQPLPISRKQAWAIIREIGAGLECAHAHNVVHADLKPHNIMITESGEVRILDFGASRNTAERTPKNGVSPRNAVSATPAYASCELLEGRPPEPADDIYAFACLSYELLAGAHPFHRRRSTDARDFAIIPTRPAGLRRRQWLALNRGLSWHRGGRTISVGAWLDRLNIGRAIGPVPRARDLGSAPAKPLSARSFWAGPLFALLLMGVAVWVSVAGVAGRKISNKDVVSAAVLDAPSQSAQAQAPIGPDSGHDAEPASLSTAPAAMLTKPPGVSASNYAVHSGDHFAEIRVHRFSRLGGNTPLVWWTEAASAKPGVDYVPQGKAIQSFPKGKSATSFFVKLVPKAFRTQPEVFYIAIARAGHGSSSGKIERTAVWLPTSDGQS